MLILASLTKLQKRAPVKSYCKKTYFFLQNPKKSVFLQ
jgi:hypothetical protein